MDLPVWVAAQRWYSEHDFNDIGGDIWFTATAKVTEELGSEAARCIRCGRVRTVTTGRRVYPLCRDCKGSMTSAEKEKWL